MEPEFKLATPVDIPLILKMMERFYQIDAYPFDEEKNRRNLHLLLSNENLGRLWLIKRQAVTIGYIALCYGFSFEYGGRDAFIDEFFIEADYRNQGVGRKTLEFVAAQAGALGVHALHLEVENHNEKGKHLYAAQGFTGKQRAMWTKWVGKSI